MELAEWRMLIEAEIMSGVINLTRLSEMLGNMWSDATEQEYIRINTLRGRDEREWY